MSAVVQVFPNRVGNDARGGENADPSNLDGSAVIHLGNYLPSLSTTEDRDGQQGNQDNAANVFAALNAPTDEFEAFVDKVTQLPTQVDRPIGSRATNAALWHGWSEYSVNGAFEVSRMNDWGDYRPYRRGGDRHTPLNGKPITFDPDDQGIRFDVPYELAHAQTTVTQEDYDAVYYNHREAHVNQGNPLKHRLQVYNLNGMNMGGGGPTDIA